MRRQNIIGQWFELHGPGLKARGVKWVWNIDTDTYEFWRETTRTSDNMLDATTNTAVDILRELDNG